MILAMMLRILSLSLLVLGGCASVDDRICLEWTVHKIETTECIPMYGQLICSDTIKTRHACVMYAEDDYDRRSNKRD